MEPLSRTRPKCLLPFGCATVLSLAAERVLALRPRELLVNATGRPDLVAAELAPLGSWRILPEPEPLGVVRTLAGLADGWERGTLVVSNTDMVTSPDLKAMLDAHRRSGAHWTALAGPFPERGSYGGIFAGDDGRLALSGEEPLHYYGVSLLEPEVLGLALNAGGGGMFGGLLSACLEAGMEPMVYRTGVEWLDMGSLKLLRENILAGGSWISPEASVDPAAHLEGTVSVGDGCRLGPDSVVRDSVMLAGSSIGSGRLTDAILPWSSSFEDGGAIRGS